MMGYDVMMGYATASPSLRDCIDEISVCMNGHSVLCSNSKLHDNFGKMETRSPQDTPHHTSNVISGA